MGVKKKDIWASFDYSLNLWFTMNETEIRPRYGFLSWQEKNLINFIPRPVDKISCIKEFLEVPHCLVTQAITLIDVLIFV